MPYIAKEARGELDPSGGFRQPKNAGELNYQITRIVHDYWTNTTKNYQAFNDIIGALEGCKLELYRRKVAPYEDKKIEENGDV